MSRDLDKVATEHEAWVLAMRTKLRDVAEGALRNMIEMMESAESESVRYSAAKDLLDRAGIKPPPAAQLYDVDVVVRNAELAEVDRAVDSLLVRLGRNQAALPAHTLDLDVLIVLEGEDDELIPADVVLDAIEVDSTEV